MAKDLLERPESKFEEDEASNNAPRHWLERGPKLSHASSLVVDPPDGRLPALTAEGRRRAALGLRLVCRGWASALDAPAYWASMPPEDRRAHLRHCCQKGLLLAAQWLAVASLAKLIQTPIHIQPLRRYAAMPTTSRRS